MEKKHPEDAYFVASNSVNGFQSYYQERFEDEKIQRIYLIKGGPGTGKSRLMREVARMGEKKGWRVEYIYCSSDPSSLDAVILSFFEKSFAVLDATAPHVYEPTVPGIREEIINLGDFWDSEELQKNEKKIQFYQKEKQKAYRQSYRYLSAYGEMSSVLRALIFERIKRKEMRSVAEKIMREIPDGTAYSAQTALISAFSMQGDVTFDCFVARATFVWKIVDYKEIADLFLQEVRNIAERKKLSIRISYSPLEPDKMNGIFLCDSKVAFLILPAKETVVNGKTIRMSRFLSLGGASFAKAQVYYAERMMEATLSGAREFLQMAGRFHFELEKIYSSAMDFERKEEYTKALCERLFQ